MKISKLAITPYKFPLSSPFENVGQKYLSREGYVIRMYGADGNFGLGEVAPLPGFNQETHQQAGQNLKNLTALIDAGKIELTSDSDNPVQFPTDIKLLPSVQFGLESAANDLIARINGIPFRKLFNTEPADSIEVNGLIGITGVSDSVKQAVNFVDSGITTIKIKIGRPNFSEDLDVLNSINREIPDSVFLRLDANQSWEPDEAIDNLHQLDQINIEYVEQPIAVGNVESLLFINKNSPIPVAVDEEISNFKDTETVIMNKAADILVMKPQVLGSYSNLSRLITMAEQQNIKIVFSSSMESPIGDGIAIQLAAAFAPDMVHGLNPDQFFDTPIGLMDCYPQIGGRIALPFEPGIALNSVSEVFNNPA